MKLIHLLDRPIAFQRVFVTITGDVKAALFFSQAVYWAQRTADAQQWFYKTQVEWQDETGLTRREQETARKTLRDLGLILEERRGIPARIFFQVQNEVMHKLCIEARNPRSEQPGQIGGKRQSITETTQRLQNTGGSDSAKADTDRGIVRRVFAHYIDRTGRNGKLYTLTEARMDKGLSRLKDCMAKVEDDAGRAEALMKVAVDALVESKWHMGENDKQRQYTDWTDHLFKSTDRLEKWLEQ